MKAEINAQSKNEIGELLNEYVVSPLNQEVLSALQRTEDAVGGVLTRESRAIQDDLLDQIGSLKRGLRTQTEDQLQDLRLILENVILDADQDTREAICETLSALAVQLGDTAERSEALLSRLDQGLAGSAERSETLLTRLNQHLANTAEQNEALLSQLDQHLTGVRSGLERTARDGADALRADLLAKGDALDQTVQSASEAADRGFQALDGRLSALTEDLSQRRAADTDALQSARAAAARELESVRDSLLRRMDELEQTLTAALADHQAALLRSQDQAKAELAALAKKRHRTLAAATLILGTANLLGIAALLFLHFL